MSKYRSFGVLIGLVIVSLASAQQATGHMELGQLANGATVSFVRTGSGEWAIEIFGGGYPRLSQQKPAQIEVFTAGLNVRQMAAAYQFVTKEGDAVLAGAKF